MKVVKLDTTNLPSYVTQDLLSPPTMENPQGIQGYRVFIAPNDVRLVHGDYILVDDDDNPLRVVTSAEYLSATVKNLIHETIGKELVRELWRVLKNQDLDEAQEADLLNRIYPVLGCLADGFIRGARVMCNNTATGGAFTTARKNYLLTQINNAITKL